MSDVFWAALIAAVSGLSGAILSAFFTYRITQRRTDVEIEQRRLDRLIQARTAPLVGLRDGLSRNFGHYSTYLTLFRVVQNSRRRTASIPDEINRFEQQRDQIAQELLEHGSQIPSLIAQISDKKLLILVEEYWAVYPKAIDESTDPATVESPDALIEEMANRSRAAQSHLLGINLRIEELLAGEELT